MRKPIAAVKYAFAYCIARIKYVWQNVCIAIDLGMTTVLIILETLYKEMCTGFACALREWAKALVRVHGRIDRVAFKLEQAADRLIGD